MGCVCDVRGLCASACELQSLAWCKLCIQVHASMRVGWKERAWHGPKWAAIPFTACGPGPAVGHGPEVMKS